MVSLDVHNLGKDRYVLVSVLGANMISSRALESDGGHVASVEADRSSGADVWSPEFLVIADVPERRPAHIDDCAWRKRREEIRSELLDEPSIPLADEASISPTQKILTHASYSFHAGT